MERRNISLEAKVGLFVILAMILFVWLSFQFGGIKWLQKSGYRIITYMDTATGLEKESPVKVAGVRIGRIEDLKLKGSKAEVTMNIDPGIEIYKNATASVKSESLLGQKFIEISYGNPESGKLENNAVIMQGEASADIDHLVIKLTSIAKGLDEVVTENKENINETLSNIKVATEALNRMLTQNEASVKSAVQNIDELSFRLNNLVARNENTVNKTLDNFEIFSSSLKEKTPEVMDKFSKISKDLDSVIEENRENLKETISGLKDTTKSINNIATKIDKGEGTIGKLVNDDSLYHDAKKSLKQLGDSAEQAGELSPVSSFVGALFSLF